MDLKELKLFKDQAILHPWEKIRVWNLTKILQMNKVVDLGSVLDIGCSDGQTANQLLRNFSCSSLTGIDVYFTDDLIKILSLRNPEKFYTNSWAVLPKEKQFDTILAFDVLEHIEKDDQFIMEELLPRLKKGGTVLITVPAFSFLFSDHDDALGHYRRYTLSSLIKKLEQASLKVKLSGYFFFSLIFVRFLQRILKRKTKLVLWKRGKCFTGIIEMLLKCDGCLVFFLLRMGIKLPGLSVWAYCSNER